MNRDHTDSDLFGSLLAFQFTSPRKQQAAAAWIQHAALRALLQALGILGYFYPGVSGTVLVICAQRANESTAAPRLIGCCGVMGLFWLVTFWEDTPLFVLFFCGGGGLELICIFIHFHCSVEICNLISEHFLLQIIDMIPPNVKKKKKPLSWCYSLQICSSNS